MSEIVSCVCRGTYSSAGFVHAFDCPLAHPKITTTDNTSSWSIPETPRLHVEIERIRAENTRLVGQVLELIPDNVALRAENERLKEILKMERYITDQRHADRVRLDQRLAALESAGRLKDARIEELVRQHEESHGTASR